jgi:hypothetical protein
MDDAADLGKFTIKKGMGIEVTGRAQVAFHEFAVKVSDNQVGSGEGLVIDAAWLDDHEGLRARTVDSTDIAEGMRGETAIGDLAVSMQNLLT